MNTKQMCNFIAFNLFAFMSFMLMSVSIPLGFLSLAVTALFGVRYFPLPARRGRVSR